MSLERRNDVGSKVMVSTISLLLGVIMTITWFTAREALCLANNTQVEIATVKECVRAVTTDVNRLIVKIDRLVEKK